MAGIPANLHGLSIHFDVVQLDTEHQLMEDRVPDHIAGVFRFVVVAERQF